MLRLYAAQCIIACIGLHDSHPRRKALLKIMHKKAETRQKPFAEDKQTKDIDYWNHLLLSDETKMKLFGFRWCVVGTRWREQRQVCPYSQTWWWECHGMGLHECTGEVQFIEGTMNPSM